MRLLLDPRVSGAMVWPLKALFRMALPFLAWPRLAEFRLASPRLAFERSARLVRISALQTSSLRLLCRQI